MDNKENVEANEQSTKKWYHEEYLQSEWWKKMREERLKIDGYKCAWCGTTNQDKLRVHHETYVYLGCEDVEDLITLCDDCHGKLHKALESLKPIIYQIERDWERDAEIALRDVSEKYKAMNANVLAIAVYNIMKGKRINNLSGMVSTVKDALNDRAGESQITPLKNNTSVFTMAQQMLSCLRKPKEKKPEKWMVEASSAVVETAAKHNMREELAKYRKR